MLVGAKAPEQLGEETPREEEVAKSLDPSLRKLREERDKEEEGVDSEARSLRTDVFTSRADVQIGRLTR